MLLAQLCLSFAAPDPRLLEFTWESDSDSLDTHHAFGFALGQKFGAIIRARFAELPQLKAMMETYKSAQGAALYQSFLDAHEKEAPSAVAEIKGIAAGAELPFAQVFLQNIPLEYSDCSAKLGLVDMRATRRPRDDHCSDFQVCAPEGACVVGHNEDNGHADLNRTALVHVRFGARAFTAYTYLGELPSGAFGFNPAVAFTLNWVGPTDVVCPGLGRGFVSRQLLVAPDWASAIATASQPGQSAGHNFQLMRLGGESPAVLNLEAAPRGLYAARPIGATTFFHANQYETLSVPQTYGNSSTHRIARAAQMAPPPSTAAAIAHALGDQQDHAWPIFHDKTGHAAGDISGSWTIASALFDLRAKTLQIYSGNPRHGDVLKTLALPA
jgi:hypothetical protein